MSELFAKEVAQKYCNGCQKINWHARKTPSPKALRYGVLITGLTCFLTLPLFLAIYYFKCYWRCKFCGKRTHKGAKSKRRKKNSFKPDFSKLTTKLPPDLKGSTQGQPYENARSRKRQGSFSGSSAHLNRPRYGCSPRTYWDWHDTLYLGGSASSPEWRARAKEAKARDNYQCVECGFSETLETDHIIELSRGGSNEFDNLQTLCKECHHLKTQKNRRRRSYT